MTRMLQIRDVVFSNTGSRNPTNAPEDQFIYVDVAAVDRASR